MRLKNKKNLLILTSCLMLSTIAGIHALNGNHFRANAAATTVEMSSFSSVNGTLDEVVSYTSAKGGGTSNPAVNSGQIRLYQGNPGGNITLSVADGYFIKEAKIGSGMATSIAYNLGADTNKSQTEALAKDAVYTLSIDNQDVSSVTFHCMGTSKNARLYVNYLSVTYDVKGSTIDPSVTTYNVTFDANGGLIGTNSTVVKEVVENEVVVAPDAPTREDDNYIYTFEGWYSSLADAESLTNPFNFETTITSDISLYAGYSKEEKLTSTYSYTFNEKVIDSNGSFSLGVVTWNISGDGGYWGYNSTKGQQLGSGSSSYGTLSVKSDYFSDKLIYNVKINASGGSSVSADLDLKLDGVSSSLGTKALTDAATEYVFDFTNNPIHVLNSLEFYITQSSSKAIYIKSIEVEYANYVDPFYHVTFESNGGTEVATQDLKNDGSEKATKPTDPTKAPDSEYSYTFGGWYSDADLTTEYNFDSFVTENITLYAKWDMTPLNTVDKSFVKTETETSLAFDFSGDFEKESADIVANITVNEGSATHDQRFTSSTKFDCYGNGTNPYSNSLRFDHNDENLKYTLNNKLDSEFVLTFDAGANTDSEPTSEFTLSGYDASGNPIQGYETKVVISNKVAAGYVNYSLKLAKNGNVSYFVLNFTKHTGNVCVRNLTVSHKEAAKGAPIISNFANLSMKFRYQFDFENYTGVEESGLIVSQVDLVDPTASGNDIYALYSEDTTTTKIFKNTSLKSTYTVAMNNIPFDQTSTAITSVAYIKVSGNYYFNIKKTYSVQDMLKEYAKSSETLTFDNGEFKISDIANSFLGTLNA